MVCAHMGVGAWELDHLPALSCALLGGGVGLRWPRLACCSAASASTSRLLRRLRAGLASELVGLFPGAWRNKREFCVGGLGSYCCRKLWSYSSEGQG